MNKKWDKEARYRMQRSEHGKRAGETGEAEAEEVDRGGQSRAGRESESSDELCGVRMIDNERYKVDDLLSGRPIRKKVRCRFSFVSDLTHRQKRESATRPSGN